MEMSRNPTTAARYRTLVEVLVSLAGSLLGTFVTDALDGSPTVRLAGAALGALIPALVAAGLPSSRTHPLLAVAFALGALALTYVSLTAADYVTHRPATFPIPAAIAQPETPPRGDGQPKTGATEGALGISITPAELTCTAQGCSSPVTVTSTGTAPLKLGAIEIAGAGRLRFTHEGGCAKRALAPGDSCDITVRFTPKEPRTVTAQLVIHQNLKGDASRVSLTGAGDPGDPGDPKATLNLALSPDNTECTFVKGGALGGKDGLQMLLVLTMTGGTADKLPRLVLLTARSDSGAAVEVRTAVGEGKVVATLPLRPADFNRVHHVIVVADPGNEISETDEGDNRLVVTVRLPVRPSGPTADLNCAVTS